WIDPSSDPTEPFEGRRIDGRRGEETPRASGVAIGGNPQRIDRGADSAGAAEGRSADGGGGEDEAWSASFTGACAGAVAKKREEQQPGGVIERDGGAAVQVARFGCGGDGSGLSGSEWTSEPSAV